MGYYTHYKLKINEEDFNKQSEAFMEREYEGKYEKIYMYVLKERKKNKDFMYGVWENDGESCTWYDYKEELIELSKAFPDIVFYLSGEGEESGDVWKHYFKAGKDQESKVKITFDDCTL